MLLLTIYPASIFGMLISAILLLIYIILAVIIYFKHTTMAKISFIYSAISLVFLILTFASDYYSGSYLDHPYFPAIFLSLILALLGITAGLISLIKQKKYNTYYGRKFSMAGSILGALAFILVIVWTGWIYFI